MRVPQKKSIFRIANQSWTLNYSCSGKHLQDFPPKRNLRQSEKPSVFLSLFFFPWKTNPMTDPYVWYINGHVYHQHTPVL